MTDHISTRCERAGPDEQRELLIELWGEHPVMKWNLDREFGEFYQLLAVDTDPAYLAAAVMLVPDEKPNGWHWSVGQETSFCWATLTHAAGEHHEANMCATPALALCAAVARSLGL